MRKGYLDFDERTAEEIEAELRKISIALLRRRENRKCDFYVPTGVGNEFIRLIGNGKHFVILLSAANGIGKTTLAVNILANLIFKTSNEFFQFGIFKDFPYPKKARIASDPTTIEQTIIPELKNYFPAGHYGTSKGGKHFDSKWETDTGWKMDIMTYEQESKEFESATLGFAWFDEPPPRSIFKATVSRMRRGGIIVMTETPLAGSAWIYDELVSGLDEDVEKRGRVAYIEADVESACKQHGVRGFLEHAHIENMISQYDEEDMQARVYGKFHHLIGLVYKMFARNIHVIRPFPITMEDFVVLHALDPHPRTPDAVLWLAVNRKNQKFVVDELFIKGQLSELAQRIKQKDSQYRMIMRLADPAAFVEDQHAETGLTLAQRLESMKLVYQKATKDRAYSDRRIADALDFQRVGTEMVKAPELYVFDNCTRTIYEIEHYRWDDWRGRAAELKDPKERPVDKDDHMIESLGRLLVQEPKFVEYRRTSTPSQPFRPSSPYQSG